MTKERRWTEAGVKCPSDNWISFCVSLLCATADLDHPLAPEGYNHERDTETMIKFHLQAMDQQLVQVCQGAWSRASRA